MKMIFTFFLASVLTMSAVLGRSSGLASKQLTYEEDKTVMQSEETAQIMTVGDRSSNLKYVMAIKSSSIWEDIKKRSLTINTSQRLDDMVIEKSPENLSDQELAQFRQACQDGLKCVAVDHLLVLEQVKEQLGGGKVSVRTVITKITQVLTQYTTEYQEDVYEYEAVNDSDDESKVYKSVTTIMEDNKELCQIDLNPVTEESYTKNDESNAVPTLVVNNNNTVNYNTTENYNINNGTINSATIDKKPSDIIAVVESPEPGTQTKNNADSNLVILINPQTESANDYGNTQKRALSDESVSKALENDAEYNQARQNHAWDSESSDRYYEPVTTTDDYSKYASSAGDNREFAGQQLMLTDAPSPYDEVVAENGDHEQKARQSSLSSVTSESDDDKKNYSDPPSVAPSADRFADTIANERDTGYSDHVENNNVSLKNGVENDQTAGETDCDHDIVSAGSNNLGIVRKGYVEDGTLNNGNMVQYNINNGTINKGTISNSNAANGIISVGTVNNGPVNYGTLDTYTNNGKQIAMNKFDVQQYLSNIDKMYSTILDRLR